MQFSFEDIRRFAEWSADRNPLHVDQRFARRTHFGQTVAHGMLAVLGSLRAIAPPRPRPSVKAVDIEFRGAVTLEEQYEAVGSHDGADHVVSLRSASGRVVLLVRLESGAPDVAPALPNHWHARAADAALRDTPALRTVDDLAAGIEVHGSYPFSSTEGGEYDGWLTQTQARVLSLCSYIVGMELPGLRSLFTRSTITFHADIANATELRFRARTVRLDRQFRLLDTELQIATPSGITVATATLRSYVPFSPASPAVADAAARVNAHLLDGKVAVVVGGSRGLGAEIAVSLAMAGCHVYATARQLDDDDTQWAAEVRSRGGRVEFLQGDASDAAWCASAVDRVRAERARLDVLVLNACEPPGTLRFGAESAARRARYVHHNLQLVDVPLAAFADMLATGAGCVVCISSSYVSEPPPGFGHYVAVKQAAEGLTRTVCRERSGIRGLIVRPPVLQTRWNDTPSGGIGAMPPAQVALALVDALACEIDQGEVSLLTDFPTAAAVREVRAPESTRGDYAIRIAGTFTTDALITPLDFWSRELELNAQIRTAPYGQVLQSLLDPGSVLNVPGPGINVVLLRVRDWLRDLPDEQGADLDFVRTYLQETLRDFERAVRTHRAQALTDTVLVLCPSHGARSSAESIIVRQIESDLMSRISDVAGLRVAAAADFHAAYGVNEDDVYDPLRDEIAHIPYREEYLAVLATIVARQVYGRTSPARKVVVVDCDNTLWRGVVGEVGAEGVVFDESHVVLHRTLERLSRNGVLVCLCSKNEEADVWRVFETRKDTLLDRDRIVAAAINWLPKSQNIRTLAARLNLGLDSFVFLDDNPVECAEVRAHCPEVLTVQWPDDTAKGVQLLEHLWEFDIRTATTEDARRTEMYRDEFRRQELRAETLTFTDFIDSLQLTVDFSPLDPQDVRRAAQLTLRTNQFNFTTIRREESDIQALVKGGQHEIRTIRVRDRFGDYGLVGLLVAERGAEAWTLDSFLLSCRVLGRGVEHRIVSQLGEMAAAAGARTVRLRLDTTKRNQPARAFLEAIIPAGRRRSTERGVECEVAADFLAAIRFEPSSGAEPVVHEERSDKAAAGAVDVARLRRREQQIARTAFELCSAQQLHREMDGRGTPLGSSSLIEHEQVASVVQQVFAEALKVPVEQIARVDALEALGCDSLKIVEVTVALSQRFPSMPGTLLFEHRSVSAIATALAALSSAHISTALGPAAGERRVKPEPGVRSNSADIAIVGLHVRCAGANSPVELWELLSRRTSAVRPVPSERDAFLHPLADTRPHWAGLVDNPAQFDAELFGVSPREAEFMDPQLRLFLEVAWNALEDAGCLGDAHEPDTGVFAGVMYADYGFRANIAPAGRASPYRCWEGFSLANRLSQLLGFSGPSLAVDTACSSSGTALHLACAALNAAECRVAIVGGVNLILDPDRFASLGRLGILSERGQCEPFGAGADGTVLGEGAGVVVLRALPDALERGDRIYGVIKGTGLSTGNGTVGFTAPNPHAQAEAIRRALSRAGIDPRTVSYVETHGTGTHLGDPIEVRGLMLGYGTPELQDGALRLQQRTRIGSVKPNVGHLEAGAGVMGLIKVLLQMHHGLLLPSITSETPNPQIAFARGVFDVQTTLEPWQRPSALIAGKAVTLPRRAGISSFGVGGANAHIVVEEPPLTARDHGLAARQTTAADRPAHLLSISAASERALQRQAATLSRFLGSQPDASLADLCFAVNTGRKALAHRAALAAGTREELLQSLRAVARGDVPQRGARGVATPGAGAPKIAFLFTGQGSQYAGMGKALYATQPVFRAALDECAAPFARLLDRPLLEVLFAEEGSAESDLLNQTGYTQPALFAFQYALSQLWASWGIRPDVVMGHSVGEIAALCVAGGISLHDGLQLIAARGRLMQALPAGGTMASVMADESRVLAAIAGAEELVAIAAVNAPDQVVISGDGAAVAEIAARLTADGIKTKSLTVSHAFHSPLMKPMLADYERVVRTLGFSAPRVPFVSCVDGDFVHAEVTRPGYWLRQVMEPVRFASGMSTLDRERIAAYIEIGPHPVLLGMARQCVPDANAVWLPSIRRDQDAWQTLLGSIATLYVHGGRIDWRGFDAPYARVRPVVPGYDFNPKPYWLKKLPRLQGDDVASGEAQRVASAGELLYEVAWRRQPLEDAAPARSSWVVLADGSSIASNLASELQATGAIVTMSPSTEELWPSLTSGSEQPRIVDLRGLDLPASATSHELGNLVGRRLAELARLVQQCSARQLSVPSVWVVTRRAVAVDRNDHGIDPLQATGWGLGRTASLEHPEFWGGLIDIDDSPRTLRALARELTARAQDDQVALRGDVRYVARLARRQFDPVRRFAASADGTYLVTGGTGALGLHVAEWLVGSGARRIVLTSRRGVVADAAKSRIDALQRQGATVAVIAADISSADEVDRLLRSIAATGSPLRGLVHAAGIDSLTPLVQLDDSAIADAIAAKVIGGHLLHERTCSVALDLFLCFSSMAAVFGSHGRGAYAAANAFLDALAEQRRQNGLAATSVNWGPWDGGGMARAADVEQYRRVGNRALDPRQALEVLGTIVSGDAPRATVVDIEWGPFAAAYAARRARPILQEVARESHDAAGNEVAATGGPPWIAQLRQTPTGERQPMLATLLRREVADTLGFEDAESVPLDRTFYELGMDSLMMAELVGRLKQRVGTTVTALVFNHPSVSVLSREMVARLPLDAGEPVGMAARVDPDHAVAPGRDGTRSHAVAGSIMPTTAVGIQLAGYTPEAERDILEFQRTMFPDRRPELVPARWRWMFLDSARRVGVSPRIWVHRDAGRVLSHMGSIAVRLKIGDQEHNTGWLVDTIVLEEYRAQALGSRLMIDAHAEQPFSLSLGQTSEMRDIQLRLGWRNVAPLQIAQLLVRPANVLKGKLPAAAVWAADVGFRATSAVKDWWREKHAFTARAINRFDAPHDRLWQSASQSVTCAVVRDASYLNWKYVQQPGQEFLKIDLLDARGELRAVAVWMFRDPDAHYQYRRGFLVDFVASLDDEETVQHALAAACDAAVAQGVDALLCHHIDARLTKALRACGFHLRQPERFLLVDPGPLDGGPRDAVLSPDCWFVTQGDSDIDRP